MALVTRSPIRVTAAQSTAPQEAMAASLQAHIDELVQKNRTCEHTVRRLQQSLADEKERGAEVVTRLKAASQQEREAWREGCDSLLAAHRIVHLRTRIELDKERLNGQLEKEENRRERINILHRDFRLTLFQAKESELEAKIGELEDALEELTEEHDRDAQYYMERIEVLEKELQSTNKTRKDAVCRMKDRETEFASLQSEASTLRKENATLKASSESSSVKLERTTLQLEGAKTNLAELDSTNADLKRTNADLKRQLDRWQSLETKGGAEVEEIRKRRIELEVQVKELQSRVKEMEKSEKESAKTFEKERSKVEKLKKENDRMAEVTEDAQRIAKKSQDDYDEAAEQLRSTQRLIEKLQSEILSKDQVRKGKKPGRGVAVLDADVEAESLEPSEREVENVLTPVPQTRVRPRPAYRGKEGENAVDSAEEQEDEASQPAMPRARVKSAGRNIKAKGVETPGERSDAEPAPGRAQNRSKDRSSKTARKRKNKSAPASQQESEQDEDSDQEGDGANSTNSKSKGKQKAIAPSDGSENEDEPHVKTKAKKAREKPTADGEAPKNTGSKSRQKPKDASEDDAGAQPSSQPKVRKPSSSQGPRIKVVGVEDRDDNTDAQPPKKKKKRLFPPSQAETFPWDDLPKAAGFGGLNIPTQLSPVKETDAVPARSVFGKAGSSFGFR